MSLARVVKPEWLDSLPAADPRAVRSRADLRRINQLMAMRAMLGAALDKWIQAASSRDATPVRLVEIGAGDGTLLLQLGQSRRREWPRITLDLLDIQPVVSTETLAAYRALGWQVEVIRCDVFDWLAQTQTDPATIIVANLFMHHFERPRLRTLLNGIAARAQAFVCLEPRRSQRALFGSRLLGMVGCNDVTRHDAVLSVRAGFCAQELSLLWPNRAAWTLKEGAAGPFAHRFQAERKPTCRSQRAAQP